MAELTSIADIVKGMGIQSIKCPNCRLVQFLNDAEKCKRCKTVLVIHAPPNPPKIEPVPPPWRHHSHEEGDALMRRISGVLKDNRLAAGLSQRQLALRMPCPRSYISKVENCAAHPTIVSLTRIADGLGIPAWQILKLAEEV